MIRSKYVGLGVFLLSASLASSNPEEIVSDKQVKQNEVFSASDKDALLDQVNAIAVNTTVDKSAAEREEKALAIQESDLIQQQTMARFTENLFWVALVQIGISWLGIWLLWGTLRETRIAARAAQDSADSADKAVKQNRAWTVFSRRVEEFINVTPGHYSEIFHFWKNAGGTPALDVRGQIKRYMYDTDSLNDSEIPTFFPEEKWDVIGVLGPGIEYEMYFYFTKEEADLLHSESKRCFIHTIFEYKTIYSEEVCISESVEEVKVRHFLFPIDPTAGLAHLKTQYLLFRVGPQQRST